MRLRLAYLLVVVVLIAAPIAATAQTTCPSVNFLSARTINLKPTVDSHIDVVRQSDGSYTGFEVTDAAPFRNLATIPHFEKQFANCLPHKLPASPLTTPPAANPPGVGSQLQVSTTLASGNIFMANISANNLSIYFNIFDTAHNLLSQTTFTPPTVNPPFNQNQILFTLALADLNRDGNLDLIAVFESPVAGSSYFNGGFWVFLGNGDGTFQPGASQILDSRSQFVPAFSVAVGDLNGDGKPDIVLGAPNQSSFTIALGNGDGTFNPQTLQLSVPSTFFGGFVSEAIADLNGDGKPDVVLSSDSGLASGVSVAVALGNGDGTFQAITLYPILNAYGVDFSTAGVAVGDVNGDGIPDIVTASGSILFGDGKGGFPNRTDYALSATGSVMLADFDGDGITDIIIGNGTPDFLSGSVPYLNSEYFGASDPSLTVLFGSGGGAFTGAPVSDVGGGESLAAADFDGDGIPDIAVTNGAGNLVKILKGKGNGTFSPVSTITFAAGVSPVKVVAADFNHDGKQDLAVLLGFDVGASEAQIFPGNGDGTFGTPFTLPVPAAMVNFIAAPDINGDGIPDLVVTSNSVIIVWLGKGDGTFASPVFVQGANFPAVAFGDFNGDGKLDIAFTSAFATTVTVLLGNGDGTFPNSVTTTLPGAAAGGPNTLVAAKFTSVGNLDLAVVVTGATAQVAVLTGSGNGAFANSQLNSASALTIFATDVNGDKLTDLIAVSADYAGVAGGVSALLGNGDGTFQPPASIVSLPLVVFTAIADLNHDGTPDVAITATGYGVAALLNLSQPAPQLTVVSAASFAAGPLAPNEIAAGFGEGFIPAGGGDIASYPLPTQLGGITLTVQDSAGVSRLAPLFFLSSDQINFLIPPATATGVATVTVNTPSKNFSTQVQITPTAPALFTIGSGDMGSSNAAAYTIYVAGGGAQTVAPVTAPINVSQPGQVYLILFGTGFDAATAASIVAAVQGVRVPVTYSGPQPSDTGLDQVNLLLPNSLAGTGMAGVSVSIGGNTSNIAYVDIQ